MKTTPEILHASQTKRARRVAQHGARHTRAGQRLPAGKCPTLARCLFSRVLTRRFAERFSRVFTRGFAECWGACSCTLPVQGDPGLKGYLANKKTPNPLGPPEDPTHRLTVGS